MEQAFSSIEALSSSYKGLNLGVKDLAMMIYKKFNKPKQKCQGELAAFYFEVDNVGEDWFIGEIRQIHMRSKCSDCISSGEAESGDGVCFIKVRFFKADDQKSKAKFTAGSLMVVDFGMRIALRGTG